MRQHWHQGRKYLVPCSGSLPVPEATYRLAQECSSCGSSPAGWALSRSLFNIGNVKAVIDPVMSLNMQILRPHPISPGMSRNVPISLLPK